METKIISKQSNRKCRKLSLIQPDEGRQFYLHNTKLNTVLNQAKFFKFSFSSANTGNPEDH
jgi:hypothetical protein